MAQAGETPQGGSAPAVLGRPVTILLVGAGNRGKTYAHYAEEAPSRCRVVAVAEPRPYHQQVISTRHGIPAERCFPTWQVAAKKERMADAVIIATQDQDHVHSAVAFAQLGYHILLEKPMAVTEADCRRIVHAVEKAGVMMAVCHVLRYTPYMQRMMQLVSGGAIGEVVNVQHLEPIGHWHFAHSYVRGAWSKQSSSTFMLMAKCCHDIDLLRFLVGKPATRVSSMGGLLHFRKEKKPAEAGGALRCNECAHEPDCPYSANRIYRARAQHGQFGWPVSNLLDGNPSVPAVEDALATGPYGRCVYESDNDVCDNQVVSITFKGGTTATLTAVAFSKEICRRHTRVFGTMGELEGDGLSKITWHDFRTGRRTAIEVEDGPPAGSALCGHGGADYFIIRDFVEAVRTGDASRLVSGPRGSLESHLLVFAAEAARLSDTVLSMDDVWKYGTVIVISKDAVETSARVACFFAVVEGLQLATFPLSLLSDAPGLRPLFLASDYLTTGAFDHVVSRYGFTSILVIVSLIVVAFLGLTALVGYRFAARLPQGRGMLRTVGALANLSASILFIPFSGVLMRVFTCPESSQGGNWMGTSLRCGSSGHVILCLAMGAILALFTCLSLFLAATFLDTSPVNRSWKARTHSRVDVGVIFMKFLFTLIWTMAPLGPDSAASVALAAGSLVVVLATAWGAALWRFAPFIRMRMNALAMAEAVLVAWCGVAALGYRLFDRSLDPSLMVLIGGPVAGLAAYMTFMRRVAAVSMEPRREVEQSATALELWARLKLRHLLTQPAFGAFLQARRSRGVSQHRPSECLYRIVEDWKVALHSELADVALAPGRPVHRSDSLATPDRTPNSVAGVSEAQLQSGPGEDTRWSLSNMTPYAQARARSALAALQEAETAYGLLAHNFPTSELALMAAGSFFNAFSPFHYAELLVLHKASRLNTSLDTQYRVFRRIRELQLERTHHGDDHFTASRTMLDRVLVEQNIQEIHRLEREGHRTAAKLWTALAARVVNLCSVVALSGRLDTGLTRLDLLYRNVLRASPNSMAVLRGYASYLREQRLDEDAGQEFDNKADRLEAAHSRRLGRTVARVVYGAISHLRLESTDESAASIVVSGAPSSMGEVLEATTGACRLLNYRSSQQLVGNNVKEMLMEPIRWQHDRYMKRFASKHTSHVVGQARTVFLVNSNRMLLPCYVQVAEAAPEAETAAPRFIGIFEPISTAEQHLVFASVDQGSRIHCGTSASLDLLGLTPDAIKVNDDESVAACTYFPTLLADGPAMFLQVESSCMRLLTAEQLAAFDAGSVPPSPLPVEEQELLPGTPSQLRRGRLRSVASGLSSNDSFFNMRAGPGSSQSMRERLISVANMAVAIAERRGQEARIPSTTAEVVRVSPRSAVIRLGSLLPHHTRNCLVPVMARNPGGNATLTVVVGGVQAVPGDQPFAVLRWSHIDDLLRRVSLHSKAKLARSLSLAGSASAAGSQLKDRRNSFMTSATSVALSPSASSAPLGSRPLGRQVRMSIPSQAPLPAGLAVAAAGYRAAGANESPSAAGGPTLAATSADDGEGTADGWASGAGDLTHVGKEANALDADDAPSRTPPPISAGKEAGPGAGTRAAEVGNRAPARRSVVHFAAASVEEDRQRVLRRLGSSTNQLGSFTAVEDPDEDDGENSASQPSSHTSATMHTQQLVEALARQRSVKDTDVGRVQLLLLFVAALVVLVGAANLVWVRWSGRQLSGVVAGMEDSGRRMVKAQQCVMKVYEVVAADAGLLGEVDQRLADLGVLAGELQRLHESIVTSGDTYGALAQEYETHTPLLVTQLSAAAVRSRLHSVANATLEHRLAAGPQRQVGEVPPCHNFTQCHPMALGFIGSGSTDFWLDQSQVVAFNRLDPEWAFTNSSPMVRLAAATDSATLASQAEFLRDEVRTVAECELVPMTHFGEYFSTMLARVAAARTEVGFEDVDVHNVLANDRAFYRAANTTVQLRAKQLVELLPSLRLQLQVAGVASFLCVMLLQVWATSVLVGRLSQRVRRVARLLLLIPRHACRHVASTATSRWARLAQHPAGQTELADNEGPIADEHPGFVATRNAPVAQSPDKLPGRGRLSKDPGIARGGISPPLVPSAPTTTTATAASAAGAAVPDPTAATSSMERSRWQLTDAIDNEALDERLQEPDSWVAQPEPTTLHPRRKPGGNEDAGDRETQQQATAWSIGRQLSLRPHKDSSRFTLQQNIRMALPGIPTVLWLLTLFVSQLVEQREVEELVNQAVLTNTLSQSVMQLRRDLVEAALAMEPALRREAHLRSRERAAEVTHLASVGIFGGELSLEAMHSAIPTAAIDPATPAFDVFMNDGCVGSLQPESCAAVAGGSMAEGAYSGTLKAVALARSLMAELPLQEDDPGIPLVYGSHPKVWGLLVETWELVDPHLRDSYQRMTSQLIGQLERRLDGRWERSVWYTAIFGLFYSTMLVVSLVWAGKLAEPLHAMRAMMTRLPESARQRVPPLLQAIRDMATEPNGEVVNVTFDERSVQLGRSGTACCRRRAAAHGAAKVLPHRRGCDAIP